MIQRGNPYYSGPVSSHFDGRRFFNPGGEPPRGFKDVLRWQLGGGKVAWPARDDRVFSPVKPEARIEGAGLRVTMIGHATLLIQVAGLNILTDPVWSDRASPVPFAGPKRRNPPGIRIEDLPKIDIILVTHNHYDHLDLATLKALQVRHRPWIITPLGNDTIIDAALPGANITAMDWTDGVNAGDGLSIHCEPAHHWSARGAGDRSMALWGAFVITTPAGRIYHIGDTGYHDGIHYRDMAKKYGGFRLACLPIGAYEPRWFMKAQHQNAAEAVEGMVDCAAAYAVGHHWGTFRLTNEGVGQPVEALDAALKEKNIGAARFPALRPGDVFDVPPVDAKPLVSTLDDR